jgi:hypothetical protein
MNISVKTVTMRLLFSSLLKNLKLTQKSNVHTVKVATYRRKSRFLLHKRARSHSWSLSLLSHNKKRRFAMRKVSAALIFFFSLVLLFGCATKDYVRDQTDELWQEIAAAKQEAAEAKARAQDAIDTAKECSDKSDMAMQKADAAAERAEHAAEKAESAAAKCSKSFKLMQEK